MAEWREFGPHANAAHRADIYEAERLLRQHQHAGRLSDFTRAERAQRAEEARTLGDLDALFTDLPVLLGARDSNDSPGGTLTGREALQRLELERRRHDPYWHADDVT